MVDQNEANREIFEFNFVVERHDFGEWLSQHLQTQTGYPFLMGGPEHYDLGDLLRALLPPAKDAARIIQAAFQRALATSAHAFDLNALSILSHAAARSAFTAVTYDISNAIDTIVIKLRHPNWTETDRANAYVAIDAIVAALAAFAYDGDRSAINISKVLFSEKVFAPFSSSLFAPLALDEISRWPLLWNHLLAQASQSVDIFSRNPDHKWRLQLADTQAVEATYFDLTHVFVDFVTSVILKGIGLQPLYDALHSDGLRREIRDRAWGILYRLEKLGVIIRRPANDHDELYANPSEVNLTPAEDALRDAWEAKVAPLEHQDWRSERGRTAHQLEAAVAMT
ncbi:MAG: hypothetical protein ACLQJ0_20770 [Steroidobacteraceae bacterium]